MSTSEGVATPHSFSLLGIRNFGFAGVFEMGQRYSVVIGATMYFLDVRLRLHDGSQDPTRS